MAVTHPEGREGGLACEFTPNVIVTGAPAGHYSIRPKGLWGWLPGGIEKMRTLIYKRTHTGDPDPASGVFGNNNCMGQIRGWPFDAVIGVGGIGKYAQAEGISRLLPWIGIGAHKTDDLRRPLVTFDHFSYRGERGPMLDEIAPNLAKHIYGKNVRVITSSSLSETESAEVAKILKLARRAPPSQGARGNPRRRKC